MDVGEIKQKIAEDKARSTSSYRRYPVRFLFMEMNNNTQNEIADLVQSANGEILELSDYIMKKDDGWMTKSRFIQIIKKCASQTSKDIYVVGFSELIRFFSKKEIETTVLSLFDIENSGSTDPKCAQRRIYLICFSMIDNIYKVLQNSFARRDLLNPFINEDFELSGQYRKVCFVSSEYASNIKNNKITTSVEWIGLWRNSNVLDFSEPIWCCSKSLYEWHKKASPDNAFQIDVVNDTKDYLQKAYNLAIDFPYEEADAPYWNQLKDECAKKSGEVSLATLLADILKIDVSSTSALAGKLFITGSEFDKWLIRNYSNSYYPDTFFTRVLRLLKNNSNKEFLAVVWEEGYRISNADQLEERIEIIKELNKYSGYNTPEIRLHAVIFDGVSQATGIGALLESSQSDINVLALSEKSGYDVYEINSKIRLYYQRTFKPAYTGLSNTEKEFVINLYSNGILDKAEIQAVYPLLYSYLFGQAEKNIEGKDAYKEYLQAYRESKVFNKDNTYLAEYYSQGHADATTLYSMYYDLPRQETLVQEYIDAADIYVLDGVGAEYLPLLVDLFEMHGYSIEICDYAACHLPSITDINKSYLSAIPYREWFFDFDRDVIHGEFYRTAANIRKALDILDQKVKDLVAESSGKRIVITADHGATARARWTDTKKKYDFSSSDHEGRCCRIASKSDYEDTEDYIVYEDEIKPGTPYVISLNDQSLYNRPKYEDHGGATVEEMLVPVIVAIPQGMKKSITYQVLDDKLEVSGLDKKISFVIKPDPKEEVYVIEADGSQHALEKAGAVYTAKLNSGKEQKITVLVAGKEYRFRTKSKAKKNMGGDDGFDD